MFTSSHHNVHIITPYRSHHHTIIFTSSNHIVHIVTPYRSHHHTIPFTSSHHTVHIITPYCSHQNTIPFTSSHCTVHIKTPYCSHQNIILLIPCVTTLPSTSRSPKCFCSSYLRIKLLYTSSSLKYEVHLKFSLILCALQVMKSSLRIFLESPGNCY